MIKQLLLTLFFVISLVADTFKVSYDPDYAPFSYNVNGKEYGLLIDIWKEWAITNHHKLIFVNGKSWDNAIQLVKNGKVDFFLGTMPYDKWMKKGVKIYETSTSIFILNGNSDKDIKSIGIIGSDYYSIIKKHFPNVKIISFNNYNDLVKALLEKKVSAIYDDSIAIEYYLIMKKISHFINRSNLLNIKTAIYPISNNQHKISIFNKGFEKINLDKLKKIEKKWIFNPSNRFYDKQFIVFTEEESSWIKSHSLVKFAFMSYWGEFDNSRDIHKKLLELIAKYSGLNILPIYFDRWKDGYEEVKNGKNIYGIMGLSYSKKREKYFYYTQPYAFSPIYIIVRKESNLIKSVKDLKVVLVKSKTITEEFVKEKLPDSKIVKVDEVDQLYSRIREDYDIDGVVTFFLDREKLKKYNLKVFKRVYDKYGELYIGINRKYPELYSIINKTLTLIPKTELSNLSSDFNGNKYPMNSRNMIKDEGINFSILFNSSEIYIFLFIFIIIILIVFTSSKQYGFYNFKIREFTLYVFIFEIFMGIFMIYEVLSFEKLENDFVKLELDKLSMMKFLNKVKSGEGEYERCLLEKDKLPFSNYEKSLLIELIDNSYKLHEIETSTFNSLNNDEIVKANKNFNLTLYFYLKNSVDNYFKKIEESVDKRIDYNIRYLENMIRYQYIYIVISIFIFVLGNILVYISTRKKFIKPIEYLVSVIENIKLGKKDISKKKFYNDEIGDLIEEFFAMKTQVELRREQELELYIQLNRNIRSSFLIQRAILPDKNMLKNYFSEYFILWKQRNIVGGDIYLIDEVKDGVLIMCIDCTGHGVQGAFLTMLVKSIGIQIVTEINYLNEEPSPALILSIFNKNIKKLLKQDGKHTISNSGFDGLIFYYNKKEGYIKYAGANRSLFYIENDGELKTIKGDRYSVGYKQIPLDYIYKEYQIFVEEGMRFYLTTDGYCDQLGGEEGFPFGKRRFLELLKNNYKNSMKKQKGILVRRLYEYQNGGESTDDKLIIGLKI